MQFACHSIKLLRTNSKQNRNEILKMAIGVDTSKWKPRKIIGTPASKFRNILGVGLISVGLITGVFFHFTPVTKNLRVAVEGLYEDPIEEVERRLMIASGLPNRTGDSIRKYMEESQRPDQPGI